MAISTAVAAARRDRVGSGRESASSRQGRGCAWARRGALRAVPVEARVQARGGGAFPTSSRRTSGPPPPAARPHPASARRVAHLPSSANHGASAKNSRLCRPVKRQYHERSSGAGIRSTCGQLTPLRSTLWPAIVASPESQMTVVPRIRSKVVLPAPFAPEERCHLAGGRRKLTRSSAVTSLKRFAISLTETAVIGGTIDRR